LNAGADPFREKAHGSLLIEYFFTFPLQGAQSQQGAFLSQKRRIKAQIRQISRKQELIKFSKNPMKKMRLKEIRKNKGNRGRKKGG